jgi:hypothetical protein
VCALCPSEMGASPLTHWPTGPRRPLAWRSPRQPLARHGRGRSLQSAGWQGPRCLRFTEDSSVYGGNAESFRIPSVFWYSLRFWPFWQLFGIFWPIFYIADWCEEEKSSVFWLIFLIFLRFSWFLRPPVSLKWLQRDPAGWPSSTSHLW